MLQQTHDTQPILKQILALEGKAVKRIEQPKLEAFLNSVLNGDHLTNSLVLGATIGKDKHGIIVYLLTNIRVIRIRITDDGFDSSDIYLKQVTSINRGLLTQSEGGNDAEVRIESAQGIFGLRYRTGKEKIEEFFSSLEVVVRQAKMGA